MSDRLPPMPAPTYERVNILKAQRDAARRELGEADHEVNRLRYALKLLHAAAIDPLCNGGTPAFDYEKHARALNEAIELAERELDRGPAWRDPNGAMIVEAPS